MCDGCEQWNGVLKNCSYWSEDTWSAPLSWVLEDDTFVPGTNMCPYGHRYSSLILLASSIYNSLPSETGKVRFEESMRYFFGEGVMEAKIVVIVDAMRAAITCDEDREAIERIARSLNINLGETTD
jgi:hypothetical protein